MIKDEYECFKQNRSEYLRDHAGEFAVIENRTLVGFFPDQQTALVAMKDHVLGAFLIKKVIPESEDFIEIHTRAVIFA
jgi:hypothetical protein